MTRKPNEELAREIRALELECRALEQQTADIEMNCKLTAMLTSTIKAMQRAGGSARQIRHVLRQSVALAECNSEDEVDEKITELRRKEAH